MKISTVIAILFLSAIVCCAAEQPNIIVFPHKGVSVSKETALLVTERISEKLSGSGKVRVLEHDEIEKILETIGRNLDDCTEEGCGIELGRQLDAEKIVAGSITRIGRRITIVSNLIDVATTEREITVSSDLDDVSEERLVDYVPDLMKRMTAQIPLIGKIIEIIGDTVVVDIGKRNGVSIGDELVVVYNKLLTDPETGEWKGYLPRVVGRLQFMDFINTDLSRCIIVSDKLLLKQSVNSAYIDPGDKIRVSLDQSAVTFDFKSTPPGSEVFIVGTDKPLGVTPFYHHLKPGAYQFRFSKEGYKDRIEPLIASSGAQHRLNPNLQPETAKLTIHSNPNDAQIFINGKHIGQTPLIVKEQPVGEIKIELKKNRFLDEHKLYEVMPDRKNILKFKLKPTNWKSKNRWKKDAVLASMFIPGRGQINNGQSRGWIYLLGFGASIAMGLNSQNEYNKASDSYDNAKLEYENSPIGSASREIKFHEMQSAESDIMNWEDNARMAWISAGSIWTWNVIDAAIWGGNKAIRVSTGISPNSHSGYSVKFGVKLTF